MRVFGWVFGIFVILVSLDLFEFSLFAGLIGVIGGALCLPPVLERLSKKYPDKEKRFSQKSGVLWGVILFAFALILNSANSDVAEENGLKRSTNYTFDLTLADIRTSDNEDDRRSAISDYLTLKSKPVERLDDFYNCTTYFAHEKNQELKFGDIVDWCVNEFTVGEGNFEQKYYNLDDIGKKIEKLFSPWDGSNRELNQAVKKLMNDESSFEVHQVRYATIVAGERPPYIRIHMTFSGKNLYGGTVKQKAIGTVDIESGRFLELESIE